MPYQKKKRTNKGKKKSATNMEIGCSKSITAATCIEVLRHWSGVRVQLERCDDWPIYRSALKRVSGEVTTGVTALEVEDNGMVTRVVGEGGDGAQKRDEETQGKRSPKCDDGDGDASVNELQGCQQQKLVPGTCSPVAFRLRRNSLPNIHEEVELRPGVSGEDAESLSGRIPEGSAITSEDRLSQEEDGVATKGSDEMIGEDKPEEELMIQRSSSDIDGVHGKECLTDEESLDKPAREIVDEEPSSEESAGRKIRNEDLFAGKSARDELLNDGLLSIESVGDNLSDEELSGEEFALNKLSDGELSSEELAEGKMRDAELTGRESTSFELVGGELSKGESLNEELVRLADANLAGGGAISEEELIPEEFSANREGAGSTDEEFSRVIASVQEETDEEELYEKLKEQLMKKRAGELADKDLSNEVPNKDLIIEKEILEGGDSDDDVIEGLSEIEKCIMEELFKEENLEMDEKTTPLEPPADKHEKRGSEEKLPKAIVIKEECKEEIETTDEMLTEDEDTPMQKQEDCEVEDDLQELNEVIDEMEKEVKEEDSIFEKEQVRLNREVKMYGHKKSERNKNECLIITVNQMSTDEPENTKAPLFTRRSKASMADKTPIYTRRYLNSGGEDRSLLGPPASLGRPPLLETPSLLGRPAPLETPSLLGRPALLETPSLLGRPAPLETPSLLGRPAPLEIPSLLGRPALLETPSLLGRPAPLETPSLLGRSAPLETPSLLGRSAPLETPSLLGRPAPLETPSLSGRPALLETPSLLGLPSHIPSRLDRPSLLGEYRLPGPMTHITAIPCASNGRPEGDALPTRGIVSTAVGEGNREPFIEENANPRNWASEILGNLPTGADQNGGVPQNSWAPAQCDCAASQHNSGMTDGTLSPLPNGLSAPYCHLCQNMDVKNQLSVGRLNEDSNSNGMIYTEDVSIDQWSNDFFIGQRPKVVDVIHDDELVDNNDAGWDFLRNLQTDTERFEALRSRWGNPTIPNPRENLTCHNYRRRRLAWQNSQMGSVSRKRKASSSFEVAPGKRLCTLLDERIAHLQMANDHDIQKLNEKYDIALNLVNVEKDNEISDIAAAYGTHFLNDYFDDIELRSRQEKERLMKMFNRELQELWKRKSTAIKQLKEATDEMETFYKFYKTSNGTVNLTAEEVEFFAEQERMFSMYDKLYSS